MRSATPLGPVRSRTEVFARLASAVAGADDPVNTIDVALDAILSLLGVAFCGVILPDAAGTLRYARATGISAELMAGYAFEPGQGYVGRAFSTGRAQRSDDLHADPTSHQTDLDVQSAVRAFVAAPLVAQGQVLGILTAGAPEPAAFSTDDAALVSAVADHVAAALAAARSRADASRAAAQTAAILDQMDDAVLVVDPGGRVIRANRAAADFYDCPIGDLIGLRLGAMPWTIHLPGDAAPLATSDQPLIRALAGEPAATELVLRLDDGRERRGWFRARPLIGPFGAVQGAVEVAIDVTERHRAAEERERDRRQLAQNEKLRALGQMAGGIAHDLNHSLAIVLGYAELAAEALDGPSPRPDAASTMLGLVVRAAMDGGESVRRLLLFARPSEDAPPERVDVAALLDEVASLTAPQWRDAAQAAGRPVALAVDAAPGTAVEGHPSALRQALMNLILNANDALPQGGCIDLVARVVSRGVEVEVRDNGVGIPPDVQARVFEPFFTTKETRGTGLGLAQVFAIVEAHSGSVELESAPGRGTTFRLVLPAAGDTANAPVIATAAGLRGLRVLAVDDEPLIGDIVSAALARDGHVVRTCTTAERALELLEAEPFDVVLSDLGLGAGMNGWELVRTVRERWPRLPFALATGWASGIDPATARAAGVDAVLAKPYQAVQLRRLVVDLVESSSAEG